MSLSPPAAAPKAAAPQAVSSAPTIPFQTADLVVPGVLTDWLADDDLWVPSSPTVSFKPIVLAVSQGYFVNLLRVRQSGILHRHRHAGPVHALVLRGRWHYLEHPWIAEQGSYIFEPPGDTHTLVVPDGVPEMITWFHNSGGYTYLDEAGKPIGFEDVFTKADAARRHYRSLGRGEDYLESILR